MIPDVRLEPRINDDALTVIAAADHVAELLTTCTGFTRREYPIGEHLDPVTWAAMKAMAKAVI